MTGDLTPQPPEVRISDAERERVVVHLQTAVGEGRITLDEFRDRVDGVLRARTYGEVDQYLADLPAVAVRPSAPRDVVEIRTTASSVSRRGRWTVPRRLIVRAKAGSVKLDFTDAVFVSQVVDIELNVVAGSTTLVLPPGATANADDVAFIAGSLLVRRQRRFLRWRW